MKIVIQPEISIELDEIVVSNIIDSASNQTISAKLKNLPRSILLWGPEEYTSKEARTWNDKTAYLKVLEKLSLEKVPFL